MNPSLKILFAVVLAISVLIAVAPAQAQDTYTLLEPLPCFPSPPAKDASGKIIPGSEVICPGSTASLQTTVNFKDYVQYAYNLLIALAAVAAVFMIVWGGLQYMTTDSWQGKSAGIDKARKAVYGLLLVLAAFLILRTIDPRLVEIPTSLVKPLQIQYDKSAIADFFTQLQKEADDYKITSAALRQEIRQAKSNTARLKEELQELQYDLEDAQDAGDTDLISQLESQIAGMVDDILQEQSRASLLFGKEVMNETVRQSDPTVGTENLKTHEILARLQAAYKDQETRLKATGGRPDELRALKDHKEYSEFVLQVDEHIARVNDVQYKYLKSDTVAKRVVGSFSDLLNAAPVPWTISAPITAAGWLIYSPQEYARDLKRAQDDAATYIKQLSDIYKTRISDPALKAELEQKTTSKIGQIKSVK